MNKVVGIFQSFEFTCWASGFKYKEDYLDMMTKYSPELKPVSEQAYLNLMKVFDDMYEEDYPST